MISLTPKCRRKVSKSRQPPLPAVISDDAVAGIEIGFEHIAGEGFVFSKGLAEVETRTADEEAVQGVAGAVSLGNEFAVHQSCCQCLPSSPKRSRSGLSMFKRCALMLSMTVRTTFGTVFFDGGVCGGLGKELRQVGVCFFIEQGADEPAASS